MDHDDIADLARGTDAFTAYHAFFEDAYEIGDETVEDIDILENPETYRVAFPIDDPDDTETGEIVILLQDRDPVYTEAIVGETADGMAPYREYHYDDGAVVKTREAVGMWR